MGWLETVEIDAERLQGLPFRLPVQWINRPDQDFRGVAGMVASGAVRPGDRVRVQPSGNATHVARIDAQGGDLSFAVAGQSVTLSFTDELDISRGDLIAAADAPAEVADQFEATVVWMSEEPLLRGRSYAMKIGMRTVAATIGPLKYQIDVDTLAHLAEPYRKARRGEIKHSTGVDSPYEAPEVPELRLDTAALAPEEAVERVLVELKRRGFLRGV